jgi:hypothetical protein
VHGGWRAASGALTPAPSPSFIVGDSVQAGLQVVLKFMTHSKDLKALYGLFRETHFEQTICLCLAFELLQRGQFCQHASSAAFFPGICFVYKLVFRTCMLRVTVLLRVLPFYGFVLFSSR